MKRQVILHAFQWRLKFITENLQKIKDCGYDAIQVSPLQGCKDDGNEFWKLYQPLDMAFVDSVQIGTKEDFKELCREAKKLGIKIYVDIVLRHVAGSDTGELIPHEKVADRIKNNPYFFTNAENCTDFENRYDVVSKAFGIPMVDYNNWELQDIYIEFLDELREMGADGYRIDMGKHFATPEEGSVFWERVIGRHRSLFNYAECLECSKELLDQYTKFVNVLTDSTATDKSKMVIFIMSHDTELTFGSTKNMTDDIIKKEWKFLLENYKESHVLFYPRPYSELWCSEEIKNINLNER